MFADIGPNDVVTYTSRKMITHTISDGDEVTLRSTDQDVLVREVAIVEPGRYSGTIYGFEPSRALERNGLSLDQRVEFSEKQVFGVRVRGA